VENLSVSRSAPRQSRATGKIPLVITIVWTVG